MEQPQRGGPAAPLAEREKFQTMLILAFEVIVQPPKTHFLTFSSVTKIMKITHSVCRYIGICIPLLV